MRALAAILLSALSIAGCQCESASGKPRKTAPAPAAAPEVVTRALALSVHVPRLDQPVGISFAPGDVERRMFVVEKPGRVRVVRPGGALDPQPYLDVSGRVSNGDEQGLLGLAFHPRFADNGRLYINFTDRSGDTQIVELTAPKGGRPDPASERAILTIDQPYSNHNGGHVLFGPDGKLYVGTGDGGSRNDPQGHGQNEQSLLGKMLRIDVDAQGRAPEVIQIGLRNPWRYSFDRETGDLYIADVGQNRWEEIHVLPAGDIAGKNLGWNRVEGEECLTGGAACSKEGLSPPVVVYGHDAGCSVTGGFVYRGKRHPELAGHYFYSDHCTALLRSFRYRGGRAVEATDWKSRLDPDGRLSRITAFGEDAEGELYLASQDGPIYAITRR